MATSTLSSNGAVPGMGLSRSPASRRPQSQRQRVRRLSATARASPSSSSSMAPVARDSYSMLGIRPGDSKQDLKRAYRKLALRYHPDVCKGDECAPKFQQINAAYELLQKIMDAGMATPVDDRYFYYSDDEEDEEVYKSGWEGAWVF